MADRTEPSGTAAPTSKLTLDELIALTDEMSALVRAPVCRLKKDWPRPPPISAVARKKLPPIFPTASGWRNAAAGFGRRARRFSARLPCRG